MNHFTDIFVRRPVLAVAISMSLFLLGLHAYMSLGVRQYPLLESASITITTRYPGASAELMQGFVTQPISQSVATVAGIDYMSSNSSEGMSLITLRFSLNANSLAALSEVIAKVDQVKYRLPEQAYDPVIERSAGAAAAEAYVGFASDSISTPELTDYINRIVIPMFSGIEGVSKVQTFGGQELAMRLWLDPQRLAAYRITGEEVAQAIRDNNFQAAPGQLKSKYVISNLSINTSLQSIEDFRNMVLRNDNNRLIRVRDIGTVEIAGASTETSAFKDTKKAVHVGVFSSPHGNPLRIVAQIKTLLVRIQPTLPPGVTAGLAFDVAKYIQTSIDEVIQTLLEAIVIVILVIYLCLGSLRAILIPILTIPLSMLGAMLLMDSFDFTLNLLTLLAMVLAIGLVVDDSIVVVENVHRHIDQGKTPFMAAFEGAREIAGPVVAMTLTLCAVYAPIALTGGLTGTLFKEFALTLAGAVLISGVVALTLSPVMSSKLLPAQKNESWLSHQSEKFFVSLSQHYHHILRWMLMHRWVGVSAVIFVILLLPLLYHNAATELAPSEDQGNLLAVIKNPQQTNLAYAEVFAHKLDQAFLSLPETTNTWIINGMDGPSNGFAGVNFIDWGQRKRTANQIQPDLQQKVNQIEGSSIFIFQMPPLPGTTGGMPIQLVLRTAQDYRTLYNVMEQVKQEVRKSGVFSMVDSDLDFNMPTVEIHIDRAKANSLGIRMQDIGTVLNTMIGENYINRFSLFGRSYDVIPQALPANRLNAYELNNYYIKDSNNNLIPLSTLVSFHKSIQPQSLVQFNQQNAATLQAIPVNGVTLGDAIKYLQGKMQELPAGFSYDWQSESRQFVQEGSSLIMTFAMALMAIYLVLAVQYESFTDPLIILISVPLSICGALAPLALGLSSLNIYTQIGLITLIGLISKHGILMVAFANEIQQKENLHRIEAIIQASQVRLRPILMTTAAMITGLMPLLFAHGPGANSRFGLGLVIVVGMAVGTFFTLLILPTLYSLLAGDHRRIKSEDLQEKT